MNLDLVHLQCSVATCSHNSLHFFVADLGDYHAERYSNYIEDQNHFPFVSEAFLIIFMKPINSITTLQCFAGLNLWFVHVAEWVY